MHSIAALLDSIRQRGILTTMSILVTQLIDYGFDLRNGTDTISWRPLESLRIESENRERGGMYQPTRALPLRRALQRLRLPKGGVFVDLGCGKGRAVMVAAEFPFAAVRGIEFAPELCAIARDNCDTLGRRRPTLAPTEIIEGDVSNYPLHGDETLFFMFNPFDDTVLNRVLDHIEESYDDTPRTIRILYHNAVHRTVLLSRPRWQEEPAIRVWGNDFAVFALNSEP